MSIIRRSLAAACILLPLTAAAVTTYGINLSQGTRVGFRAHVSAFGMAPQAVTGWSSAVKGPVIAWSGDQTRLTRPVTYTLPTASLSTRLAVRDHDIQKILEAKRFPTIRFTLKAVDGMETAEVAAGKGDFTAMGEVTAHGVTHPVALACTFSRNGDRLKIDGHVPVTWANFGMTAPMVLAGGIKAANTFHLLLESTWELVPLTS